MNNEYKVKHAIKYSEVDANFCMRLDHMVTSFQDITGLHSVEMEIDSQSMLKFSNAFWVLSKWKLKIHRMPKFEETVTVETWPTFAKGVRFGRDFTISQGNQVLVSCCSEWCTIDYDTKRPRRVDSVHYPHSMPHRQDRSDAGEFIHVRETVREADYNHTHKVLFSDIDPNKHTNNIAYIRMILDCFSLEEFSNLSISEVQVSYISQTFYGNEINVYKKQTDYGYFIEGTHDGRAIFSCIITCNPA